MMSGSPELAAALEALLREPLLQANDEGDAVATEQADAPAPLDEVPEDPLDALLRESIGAVQVERDLKAAREKLSRGGLSKAEVAAINEKVREWEARVEWEPQATVALFVQQLCGMCQRVTTSFEALMERQRHRQRLEATRWVTMPARGGLPQETAVRKVYVPLCHECHRLHGFDLQSAYVIGAPKGE